MKTKWRKLVLPVLVVIVLALMPIMTSSSYLIHLLVVCLIFAVVASNWGLQVGYSGIYNFGHYGFFAIGAYTAAVLSVSFSVSPWAGMVAGATAATLAGLVTGLPTLRLKIIYFALFTFSFQMLIYTFVMINVGGLTGGNEGLYLIPSLQIGDIRFNHYSKVPAYYLALSIFLLSTVVLYRVVHSRLGVAFKALRDSFDYAISRGISPYKYKLIAVLVSAFFTGLIGGFYAYYMGVLGPTILSWGILIVGNAMLVIGGLGTFYGPIVAAFVLTVAAESLSGLGAYRYIIIASIMIAALLITPQELWTRVYVSAAPVIKKWWEHFSNRERREAS